MLKKFFEYLAEKKRNKDLKESLSFNRTIISQYNALLQDENNFILNLNNFRSFVHLYNNLAVDDKTFDHLMAIIEKSIVSKSQLFTLKWALSYKEVNNAILPTLRASKATLNENLDVIDLTKYHDKKIRKAAVTLFTIIEYYLNKQEMYLLLPKDILIFKRDKDNLSVLFGEGYLRVTGE